ncbi:SDR family oxidoreductase [Tomitella biformata]|uniref:SDR family oxidoreductase n=1 Tax=Tomitella biformata TaxID=630403 RepID=UPI000466A99E|nr:SDR family oxidoreductase [Tomitella biformata]
MTIAITGAAGQLGHLAIEALIARGVPAAELVAVVRTPAKAADLAARGVQIREADYGDPAALTAAFEGVAKLLMISASEVGQRIAQHANIIDAAKAQGVGAIVYTSLLRADTSPMLLAAEHAATEKLLDASGIPHTLLRNGWYWENYVLALPAVLEHGALVGAAGSGLVAGAARLDYAEAAAVAVQGDEHMGKVYELGGDEHLTGADLAALIAAAADKPVVFQDLAEEDYAALLAQAGVPLAGAQVLADADAQAGRGALDTDSGDLRALTGRPSTPAANVIEAALHG